MQSQSLSFETTTDTFRLSAAGCSQRGTGRENNQDAIHITPNLELLIVADGVGGERAGELASTTAIHEIIKQSDNWPISGDDDLFQQLVDEALHRASRVIAELIKIDPEFRGAATTMTLALRVDDHLFVANVGDSRAYRLRNQQLQQLTVDDSWVEILVRTGSLTREEARSHPQRNVILSSLGGDDFEADTVQVGVMSLQDGDRFLISSDGIHDVLADDELAELLGLPQPVDVIADRLIDRAVQAGGRDDVSVVVLAVSRQEPAAPGALARAFERVRHAFSDDEDEMAVGS
jgi:PPM family protein phosphatase